MKLDTQIRSQVKSVMHISISRFLGQRSEGKSRTERQQINPKFDTILLSF